MDEGYSVWRRMGGQQVPTQQGQYPQLLSNTALQICPSQPTEAILQASVTELREILACDRILLCPLTADSTATVSTEAVSDPQFSMLQRVFPVGAYPRGHVHAIDDIYTAGLDPSYLAFLESCQTRAALVMPILQGEQVWGLLAAHQCREPYVWQPGAIAAMGQTAGLITLALQQAALRAQLQREVQRRQQVEQQQQQLQASLQQQEEQLRLSMESAEIGSWAWDFLTDQVVWNQQHFRIFGLEPDDQAHHYQLWQERVHPEDRDWVTQAIQYAIAHRTHYSAEYRVVWDDGSLHWVLGRGRVICDDAGQPLRMLGIVLEITERKQLELDQGRLAALVENSLDFIGTADFNGNVLYVNPAGRQLVGLESLEAAQQTHIREYNLPEDQMLFQTTVLATVMEQGFWQGEVRLRHLRTGEAIPAYQSVFLCRDGSTGEPFGIATVVRDLREQKRQETLLRHEASHDRLTQLPNRLLFDEQLSRALFNAQRHSEVLGVAFLDLDRFKTVNDTLGHTVGDQLLQQVPQRLKTCLRGWDVVARWGGDEFTLIFPHVTYVEDIGKIARRILEVLADPFILEDRELYISASLGIALFPFDGEEAAVLLRNADTAMYRAKQQGRNTYQFYAPEMNPKAREQLELETDLRKALARDELLLYYQPQVDISSGKIVGLEALLRWQQPRLGMVPPCDFIPIAEETGLICPIGNWVIRAACQQHQAWRAAGLPPMRVAVNLSARQFQRCDLVATIVQILQETRVEPRYLELEITESAAMQDMELTVAVLQELRQMGCRIAMDDFGTGYSSLNSIKHFPLHTIKIDQSFVRDLLTDPSDAAIAKAVIALGQGLHLKVLAEGVETDEHLKCLRDLQCDMAQGYLFSKPMPAAEMTSVLLKTRLLIQSD
jgi:diguanylate cyclase (GGDEF)-like protein/PAS domain S-box-containing protein